ncbi:MAG: shikimate dehydrogenase, partial [Eubacterium sp.]|nr:shikimate dehydrogenase [Eubacterium sp.]
MRILLFGVSNVGKSTTGKLLADQLGIAFYDLDDEVRDCLGISLEEFVNTADLRWRDQKRG